MRRFGVVRWNGDMPAIAYIPGWGHCNAVETRGDESSTWFFDSENTRSHALQCLLVAYPGDSFACVTIDNMHSCPPGQPVTMTVSQRGILPV